MTPHVSLIERDVYHKDEVVSRVKFEFSPALPTMAVMHHEVYKWTPEIYKESLLIFAEIKKALKESGINKIIVAYNKTEGRNKVVKYWKLWGFYVTELDSGVCLGELEI